MPQISVITALHNKEAYVGDTIRSVLAQTMPDWEMVVVENGSTDNGPEVVRQFSDPRVQLVILSRQGPGAARNRGLESARGDWVLFLDADDLLDRDYLERRLGAVARLPQSHVVAGPWMEFQDEAGGVREIRWPSGFGGSTEDVLQQAVGFAPWAVHAAMVRRTWIEAGRGWFEEMDDRPSEDTSFWFRLLHNASVAWCDNAGAQYRVATVTSRNKSHDPWQWFEAVRLSVERNLKTLEEFGKVPTPGQCETLMRVFEAEYRRLAKSGDHGKALQALRFAQNWMNHCHVNSVSMGLRRVFGIPLVTSLSNFRSVTR